MNLPLVYSVQKYTTYDGEEIRTTVFFKGCPLQCKWCSSPESQNRARELLFQGERCVGCRECEQYCPSKAISYDGEIKINMENCIACGICSKNCLYGAMKLSGQEYRADMLADMLLSGAGEYGGNQVAITLSGGEVMSQEIGYIEELVKILKDRGCNIAVDTCGYAEYEKFRKILPYINTFLYDIKVMSPEKHKKLTGVDNTHILHNLIRLSRDKASIVLRMPLIHMVNDTKEDLMQFIYFVKKYKIHYESIHLLPYDDSGKDTYMRLGRPYLGNEYQAPSESYLMQIKRLFEVNGLHNIRIE